MRRHMILIIAVMVSLTAIPVFAAQNSASTSANATARIITAIAITKNTDLNFGDVVPGTSIGTVVVTPAGARSSTGGASLGNGSAVTAATFSVTGQGSETYAVTLPASITINGGGSSMTVDTFASTPNGTGTLSAGGSDTLSVGATLNVGASQAVGTYTGSFSVTVAYN